MIERDDLPERLQRIRAVEAALRDRSVAELRALHEALAFYCLLTADERRRLARLFPSELALPPLFARARRRWDLRAGGYLRRLLRFHDRVRELGGELVCEVGPEEPAPVGIFTVHGSALWLGPASPLDPRGARRYRYTPLAHHLRAKAGSAVWRAPLRVGEAPRVGSLQLSRIAHLARAPASGIAAALVSYAEQRGRLEQEAGESRCLAECEALGLALWLQERLGESREGVDAAEVAELWSASGTHYRLVGGRRGQDLERTTAAGERERLAGVTLAPQRVVVGAPLVFLGRRGDWVRAAGPVVEICRRGLLNRPR